MRRCSPVSMVVLLCTLAFASIPCVSQQEQFESNRKVVNKVVPGYPAMARTLNLKGSVRLEALVLPNGSIKTVEVKGGHPVLAQAAENAIRKWKWEPAAHETVEPIEVKFDPQ
jgi:TonB family protein